MITVYHLSSCVDRVIRDDLYYHGDADHKQAVVQFLWANKRYDKVAVIDTDKRAVAFRLTNHIDEAWDREDDPRVTVLQRDPRSTSVCDLMEQDGVFYYVDRNGYVEMSLTR